MQNRHSFFSLIKENIESFTIGTTTGLAARYFTFTLENAVYVASTTPNPNYWLIYQNCFKPETFKELHGPVFRQAGLLQTIGKSASSMGVATWVDRQYGHLSAFEKGALTATFGFIPEAATTASGEARRVQLYQNMQNRSMPVIKINYLSQEYMRVFTATSIRAFWTSLATFTAIHKTNELFKPLFPKEYADSPVVKASAALTSTFLIQPLNMPIINFHTYLSRNPKKSYREIVKGFYKENTFTDLFRGSLSRCIHRGVFYAFAFFFTESTKNIKKPEPIESKPKTPKPS